MSTNPKSYAGFQGKYPLLVTFDSDGTPPILERIESKPHYDDDFYMDPPPYPPSEAYPTKQFPRINRKNPPPECYFVRPIVDYKVTIGPRFAIPMKQLRNKLRDLIRYTSYIFAPTITEMEREQEDSYSADDMVNILLDSANLALDIASSYKERIEMETSFNRWKIMLMDTYYKIHVGLEILATSVYCEVDGEWRVFDNRIILWLVTILIDILCGTLANPESCMTRWWENTNLWSCRNYHYSLYAGCVGRLGRAVSYPQSRLTASISSSTATPHNRQAIQSQSVGSRKSRSTTSSRIGSSAGAPTTPTSEALHTSADQHLKDVLDSYEGLPYADDKELGPTVLPTDFPQSSTTDDTVSSTYSRTSRSRNR